MTSWSAQPLCSAHVCNQETHTDKPTNRQTDTQTNQQTDRQQTNQQTDRHTDKPTDRQTDRQTNQQTDRQTDNRQTDRQTDNRQTNRQTDNRTLATHNWCYLQRCGLILTAYMPAYIAVYAAKCSGLITSAQYTNNTWTWVTSAYMQFKVDASF